AAAEEGDVLSCRVCHGQGASLSCQPRLKGTGMFMDSAVQDAAIASAGLLRRPLVSFHRDDTQWALPATASQFPGNGASDDPRTDDADVIRLHRIGFSQAVHR